MAKNLQTPLLPRHWQEARMEIRLTIQTLAYQLAQWFQKNWFRLLLVGLLVWILLRKDLTLQLSLENHSPSFQGALSAPLAAPAGMPAIPAPNVTANESQQREYVRRFAALAQEEMRRFGIPASITLAQGLLETNAGLSPLAQQNNNHFGIKCFSKTCRRGHCSNFGDDSHKDFFRIYPSAWESFRSHSQLLQANRYRSLFQLDPLDYRSWAQELCKAGYATDRRYDRKLIGLIERLKLYEYDA